MNIYGYIAFKTLLYKYTRIQAAYEDIAFENKFIQRR